jgi:hypothetical protein
MQNIGHTFRAIEASVIPESNIHCIRSHPGIHFVDMSNVNLVLSVVSPTQVNSIIQYHDSYS